MPNRLETVPTTKPIAYVSNIDALDIFFTLSSLIELGCMMYNPVINKIIANIILKASNAR